MSRLASVELHAEELHFSAGHFTIFSATEREDLHGHNYTVTTTLHLSLPEEGLGFDYRFYKDKIRALCVQLDRRFLLPAHSRFLRLEENENNWIAHFNHEPLSFLKRDVMILPISNVTIEELSHWFLQELIKENQDQIKAHHIHGIVLKVSNGPGQSGGAQWGKLNLINHDYDHIS